MSSLVEPMYNTREGVGYVEASARLNDPCPWHPVWILQSSIQPRIIPTVVAEKTYGYFGLLETCFPAALPKSLLANSAVASMYGINDYLLQHQQNSRKG
jgi:hypothetical protein